MPMHHRYASLVIALTAAAWMPAVGAASAAGHAPERPEDPAAMHAPERPEQPAAAPGSSAAVDAQIAHLRAIRERLSRASSPEERDTLIAERATVMQDAMAGVHAAGARGPAGGCRSVTSQQEALMQEMMLGMEGVGTRGVSR